MLKAGSVTLTSLLGSVKESARLQVTAGDWAGHVALSTVVTT